MTRQRGATREQLEYRARFLPQSQGITKPEVEQAQIDAKPCVICKRLIGDHSTVGAVADCLRVAVERFGQ